MDRLLYSLLLFLLPFTFSCVSQRKEPPQEVKGDSLTYPDHVGDSAFDKELDDPSFKVCSEGFTRQYYSFGTDVYEGEKPVIVDFFRQNYRGEGFGDQTGYVIIRFIVNCQGRTGRFRVQEMDLNYQPIKLNSKLIDQLLRLTKELDGWKPAQEEGKSYDYYYYLSFQLVNGQIKAIMP
jgi:hypothetical protein